MTVELVGIALECKSGLGPGLMTPTVMKL